MVPALPCLRPALRCGLAAALAASFVWASAAGAVPCVGDCDADGGVDVAEVVSMVALAQRPLGESDCRVGDLDGDAAISPAEIRRAVDAALNGCPVGVERRSGSIVVRPSTILLPESGASQVLTATVLDERGEPTGESVTWHSSDPTTLSVSPDGTVTAVVDGGAAQIVARSGELESAPVLAVVARPVEGAVLVPDDSVVGAPVAIDPEEDYDLGWRYQVVLRNAAAIAPGDLLVGTGEQPVGGRVLAVDALADEQRVTVAVVSLEELFEDLVIDESIDLARAPVDVAAEILDDYRVRRLADGTLDFVPVPVVAGGRGGAAAAMGTRALGPFECETDIDFPIQLPRLPEFRISPELALVLSYDRRRGGLRKLALVGELVAKFEDEFAITAALEGKIECEVELAALTIPIGGPLAFVVGGQVPLGVGFDLEAKLALARLGAILTVEGRAGIETGIECTAGSCGPLATATATIEPELELLWPDPTEQFAAEIDLHPFAFADLALGSRLSKRLRLALVRITAGAEKKIDLQTVDAQFADPDYASEFGTKLLVRATIGEKLELLERLKRILRIAIEPLEITVLELELARSPRGTLAIEPPSVRPGTDSEPGETAVFTLDLEPTTYFGLYAIDRVEIRWKRPREGGGFVLEPGRPSCRTIQATEGQSRFECETDFLEDDLGTQTFHAFVHARLFGVPLPVPLEIAADGSASVEVALAATPTPTRTRTPTPAPTPPPSARLSVLSCVATARAEGGARIVLSDSCFDSARSELSAPSLDGSAACEAQISSANATAAAAANATFSVSLAGARALETPNTFAASGITLAADAAVTATGSGSGTVASSGSAAAGITCQVAVSGPASFSADAGGSASPATDFSAAEVRFRLLNGPTVARFEAEGGDSVSTFPASGVLQSGFYEIFVRAAAEGSRVRGGGGSGSSFFTLSVGEP